MPPIAGNNRGVPEVDHRAVELRYVTGLLFPAV
jgi:hypothetical protein